MANKKLWIFGSSLCLPYGLKDAEAGWDKRLADKLQAQMKNFAKPGVDNFFIFATILENFRKFKKQDIIVVGWSHPSRKTFVEENKISEGLVHNSMFFTVSGKKFFRSWSKNRRTKDTLKKWFSMKPKDSGIDFYDRWFRNYYSLHEQKINFKSYLLAVDTMLSKFVYVPFYFSRDSVKGVIKVKKHMCQTEYVASKKLSISDSDAHMNKKGHSAWAEKIYKQIKNKM